MLLKVNRNKSGNGTQNWTDRVFRIWYSRFRVIHCPWYRFTYKPKIANLIVQQISYCMDSAKVKGKVFPVLQLSTTPWRHIGEFRYSSTQSLISALDGGEWSASRPGRFTPRERAPRTHWIGDWVDSRAVLDAVVERKIPSPSRESNPRTSIMQPAAQRYTDWANTALKM
jgi:hypothetical protein